MKPGRSEHDSCSADASGGGPNCRAPFVQLHCTPDGDIAVCSKSTLRVLGNVSRDRILDVWRGPALAAIRSAMASRFPDGCDECSEPWARGSVRDNPLHDFDPVPLPVDADWPSRLEFAFTDLCNLGCRHCTPLLSSVLRVRARMPERPRLYGDAFFAELESIVPHLREVSFLGGEPLLQPEVHRVMEMLVRAGGVARVHVTTNGTVWNDRVARYVALLPVSLAVSLDATTASTYEYIRVGARFGAVMANVAQMREAVRQRGMQMGLNFCLMAVNWSEFAGFLEFAEELEARPWVTLVEFPRKRSLLAMPRARLCRVVDQLRERPPRVEPGGRGAMLWESMLQSLAVFAACENTGRAERVVSSLLGRARWLWRIGQHDAALAVASRVDRVSPLHREARVQRAQWHAARGEPTAAARLLESVGDGGAAGAQPPIAVPPVT